MHFVEVFIWIRGRGMDIGLASQGFLFLARTGLLHIHPVEFYFTGLFLAQH